MKIVPQTSPLAITKKALLFRSTHLLGWRRTQNLSTTLASILSTQDSPTLMPFQCSEFLSKVLY